MASLEPWWDVLLETLFNPAKNVQNGEGYTVL